MKAEVYHRKRKNIGTQTSVAALLGINRITLAHREAGTLPINKEAELALLQLQPMGSTAKRIVHTSEDGNPYWGHYGIAIKDSQTAEIVVQATMLLINDSNRDEILNLIIDNELRGVRMDFIRYTIIPSSVDDNNPTGYRFEIFIDAKDYAKKGGKFKGLIPRRINYSKVRGGFCRVGTKREANECLTPEVTLKLLIDAGHGVTDIAIRRAVERGWLKGLR